MGELTKLCYNRKKRIAACAPPDLVPEDADHDSYQSGHFYFSLILFSSECHEILES